VADKAGSLALGCKKINLLAHDDFKTAGVRISFWFTVPVGFATGMLAATIAVGGFIGFRECYVMGVGGLVASASEWIIAFAMGLCGTINWPCTAWWTSASLLIILAGSLLGVHLGAIAPPWCANP
jgi:uncharacterized membrane protein YfcA